ncbi:MAG: hypothetical protein LBJ91_03700 [Clostridiales Family XIII bacterium]|jgi:hypothetical protein|nr:hypothetical protein [Clostridiales Family XIII bacterium]
MATAVNAMEKNVSSLMDMTLEEIKRMSPSEIRIHIEKSKNSKLTFVSAFPAIGRGNVLRENLATTEQLNAGVDEILRNE